MKRIILMRGIPGSGKSFLAELMNQNGVFSTDQYWYDEEGIYRFDPVKLQEAHEQNRAQVERMLARFDHGTYIVDNTNIGTRDVAPYFDLAVKYGAEISIVQVDTPLEVCLVRNSKRSQDRRIPEDVIARMFYNMVPMSCGQQLNFAHERANQKKEGTK